MGTYNTIAIEESSEILIWSEQKDSRTKKKVIDECNNIINIYGHLVDFKKNSEDSINFLVEINPLKINLLIDSLKLMGFINKGTNKKMNSNDLLIKGKSSMNIHLTFHPLP